MKELFFDQDIQFQHVLDEETEFIPLLSPEDEDSMNNSEIPELLSILPLRNTVLFPGVVIPITVGRDKSINLIKDANRGAKIIGVVSQKDDKVEDPGPNDINKIGTLAYIIKMLRLPDGNTTVIIQGKRRFEIKEVIDTEPYLKATVIAHPDIAPQKEDKEFGALVSSVKDLAVKIIKHSPNIPSEAGFALQNIESPPFLINFISSNMNSPVEEKQKILEIAELKQRANTVLESLTKEFQLLELKNQIQSKVKHDLDKQQRDYFLHQQIKTIQEELGGTPHEIETNELKERSAKMKWPEFVAKAFTKEMEKLERMNPNAAEHSVQVNYLENLLDLPWSSYTEDNFDLKNAQKILDDDHYGLEDVKERIIEHLAVLKLKGDLKAPILCLYGPPGVGKTSLGKSIAKALGRKFTRMSLGGLKDESEIRGHRKTYIGAMPGRILQNLKKAESSNPVFILDEIDKVGNSFHGDPSSALLEVLDPEQNSTFYDNFIELDYDLSKVMFIATANSLSTIQPALRDRMEIIDVSGYTQEEKVEIAKQHLIPKQISEHGLTKNNLKFKDDAINKVIEGYTRESGVRNLDKRIAKLARNAALQVAVNKKKVILVDTKKVTEVLGPELFHNDTYADNSVAGVVTGLAWTSVGGDILFIESSATPGNGKLTLTGNLGDVMKESAALALEFIKSHCEEMEIDANIFNKYNFHIHVPEGATPKDGPSAGVTMLTALTSLLTQRKVKSKLAMTGEITLRGKVLPVGGIKEKILAAKRAGIDNIILCADNKKDIEKIKPLYLKGLNFYYVTEMKEVLELALLKTKVNKPFSFSLAKEISKQESK